jgi:hypothetical protein
VILTSNVVVAVLVTLLPAFMIKLLITQDNDHDRRNRPKPSRILPFTAVYEV